MHRKGNARFIQYTIFSIFQHSLAIVHTRRSFGRSFVTVYIDQHVFYQANLKYPVTDVSPPLAIQELRQISTMQQNSVATIVSVSEQVRNWLYKNLL